MRLIFIGDIVGKPGRDAVQAVLRKEIKDNKIDFVIANAENIAHGRGMSPQALAEMMSEGVTFFTGGDHTFWQKDTEDFIDKVPVIRPANYPSGVLGEGHKIIEVKDKKILIINLLGRTFLNERLDDPFTKLDEILDSYSSQDIDYKILDFHAEASSEKYAMGHYADGRIDVMVGTHTHVPTADCMVLPKGTMFVSDIGMTGILDAVLGVKKDIIISLYKTGLNQRFEWEDAGKVGFRSVIIDLDKKEISRLDLDIT